mmetsp:Transcript_16629/g.42888  ORF Transcript_16629/g.42888 Transcript_16629/m.42888 type:complete len:147 (-) Transcript_16629:185-625(-)
MRPRQSMFPFKHGMQYEDHSIWSKMLVSMRKDVECTFGSLKKRFLWLKSWKNAKTQGQMDNVFVTCCILHNVLLEDDGILDYDDSMPHQAAFSDERGDGSWTQDMDEDMPEYTHSSTEFEWWERTIALFEHYSMLLKGQVELPGDE